MILTFGLKSGIESLVFFLRLSHFFALDVWINSQQTSSPTYGAVHGTRTERGRPPLLFFKEKGQNKSKQNILSLKFHLFDIFIHILTRSNSIPKRRSKACITAYIYI